MSSHSDSDSYSDSGSDSNPGTDFDPSSDTEEDPLHARLLSVAPNPQNSCPLFKLIPAEIRTEIFRHALADFPDPSAEKQYETDSCYTRPHYFSPRKSDLSLLRTCHAIYGETWFLPFVLREQTHWMTARDRAPPEYGNDWEARRKLANVTKIISKQQGVDAMEIQSLRVFAQMIALEQGRLARLLKATPCMAPRSLTLSIRHADWWSWEIDEPLRFMGNFIARLERHLPGSVREIHIELESLERKKDQIDWIAKQMAEKWYFKRKDGVALFPDVTGKDVKIDRWSGSSRWGGETWTRDESAPGRLDYYIATVTFRPRLSVERRGGQVSLETVKGAEEGAFRDWMKMDLRVIVPGRNDDEGDASVHEDDIDDGEEEETDEEEEEEEHEENESVEFGFYLTLY